jgi:Protein of unknown function (DUF3300)
MRLREGPPGRRWWVVALTFGAVLAGAPFEALAQETAPAAEAPEEAPAADEAPAPVEGALSDQELQALVAPIALYPDLVLVLTLQAALAPLDIVQADRFLDDYAEDPTLEPDPDWDESVIGLLNYPSVVSRMSGDLDWTQSLGDAVIDQLEGVQDAIQEFRAFMHAIGALESNEQATVIAEGDLIRIEPTDQNAVFIPEYDPDALLAALYSTDTEEAPTGQEAVAAEEVVSESAEVVEEAPVESAASAPAPEAMPVAQPAYYPAVAPPPVTYSDPSPSWLGTAATFAGGAVVGGLVGWAIADDDDHHDGGDKISKGNVNIEDSTIVVNRGDGGRNDGLDDLQRRAQNERLKRDARDKVQREQAKRDLEQRFADRPSPAATRSASERKVPGLSTSKAGRSASTRSSGRQQAARPSRTAPAKTARAGDSKRPQATSVFGGAKESAVQAKRDSDRGLKSRSRATTAVKPNRSRGSGGVFAQRDGGSKAGAARKQRGQKSKRGRK